MDSEPKEVKQDIAINMEAEDQAVDVAQVAPAIQAEGSALAGGSTQENPHPPTLEEITAGKLNTRAVTPLILPQLILTARSDRISALRELPRHPNASGTTPSLQRRHSEMARQPPSYALLPFLSPVIRTLTSYLRAIQLQRPWITSRKSWGERTNSRRQSTAFMKLTWLSTYRITRIHAFIPSKVKRASLYSKASDFCIPNT